ncbi:MAG: GNAT family N-acetyltransferase [bacterium]|nr:GNAT family N-acetyltransferase [bacterium]
MTEIKVQKLSKVTELTQQQMIDLDLAYQQIVDLISELYPDNPRMSFDAFKRTVESDNVSVYMAHKGAKIVGTASIAHYVKMGGQVWVIEDVVVDEGYRGQGIGKMLNEVLIADAKKNGATFVDVSTRHPKAIMFYEALGFEDKNKTKPIWVGRKYLW